MNTVVRRRRESRISLPVYKRHELLTGQIVTVVSGYNGCATGSSKNLMDYIDDNMRRDWANHREALMAFWESGKSEAEVFPDCLPWLCTYIADGSLPWACRHLDGGRTGDA